MRRKWSKPGPAGLSKAAVAGWLGAGLVGGLVAVLLLKWDATHPRPPTLVRVTVYNSDDCECCLKWVSHLRENGFDVRVEEHHKGLERVNALMGIPKPLAACHTAIVGSYVLTGHVPANDIRRLLAERPKARGLAVPGMPVGSPGMEQGDRREPYEVLLFKPGESTQVWNAYGRDSQHGKSSAN